MTDEVKPPRRRRARTLKPVSESDSIGGNETIEAANKNERDSEKLLKALQFNHRHGYGDYDKKDKGQ